MYDDNNYSDNYEGSKYAMYDHCPLVIDKMDTEETTIYYSYWEE